MIIRQVLDVLQSGTREYDFEGMLKEAAWGEPYGTQIAPHNWGSLTGFWSRCQFNCRMILASVPDTPGFGLGYNSQALELQAKALFDLTA